MHPSYDLGVRVVGVWGTASAGLLGVALWIQDVGFGVCLRRGVYPDFGAVMSAQLSTLGAPAVRKS